ncbi:RNA-guided endonuclease InsQ/TnpB family protein [Orrella sp. 11846]|uniref:RNA-guided endonuclease InsQ/TnpB family protein n=1 Tax=Orrella sp. 11846 TaxID=3409913 RepID=UPI003B5A1537
MCSTTCDHTAGGAFKRFFAGQGKYPRFRKKGVDDRFSLSNDQFHVDGKRIKIPKLGFVRMREKLRFNGKILSAKVFRRGVKWFVSISVELSEPIPISPKTGQSIGIDLGILNLATLSNGEVKAPLKALQNKSSRLRRANQALSRQQIGSRHRAKAKTKLGTLHSQVSNARQDFLHQITTDLVRKYDEICIEDLNVNSSTKPTSLAKS